MTAPENTSADRYLNALGVLAVGSEAWITGQERTGQSQLINSTSLPTDSQGTDAEFLALGFTFGEPDPRDPMFRPATLPNGWRKERSDHAMWSYVVDELGRRRVAVFYKAAFYDRSAFMRLETVFGYASTLAYDEGMPVFDDSWCTREAFAEAVSKRRAQIVERIEMYRSRLDDERVSWAADSLKEAEAELAKHDAWAAKAAADG